MKTYLLSVENLEGNHLYNKSVTTCKQQLVLKYSYFSDYESKF